MLTIREILQLSVFAPARLVAGKGGLENLVRWVHTVDIPDAQYRWQREGVLLLTAGFGLQDNEQRQIDLIHKLVQEKFAGMVLCVEYYFDRVPNTMRKVADELDFPIIETPPDLLFISITEAVLERIINRQYALLQQSSEIFAQLTDLVLRGGDLGDLADTLATLINRSVIIEDPTFMVLATSQQGEIDEARQRSILNGRTTPEVAQRLLDAGVYERVKAQMDPMRVLPMPELGMTMERLLMPIIVDREIHGYIWTITDDKTTNELDELATRHGATVAALIMFKERAVQEAEAALRGDFFEQLLNGMVDRSAFQEQARRLNFRIDRPHQIVLVHGPPEAGGSAHPLLRDVNMWLHKQALNGLTVWRDECVVLVLERQAGKGAQLAERIVSDMSHPARRLLIGVGNLAPELRDVKASYAQAWEAIQIGRALGNNEGVCVFEALGLWHWLFHLPPDKLEGNAFLAHVYTLAEYDASRDAELVRTLEGYLDHGGSLVETAEALHIHRNTLIHRIKRIEELCGVDLRHPIQQLNLHVAVKSYRLNEA